MPKVRSKSVGFGLYLIAGLALTNACGENQATFSATEKVASPKLKLTPQGKDANAGGKNGQSGGNTATQIGIKPADPSSPNQGQTGEKKVVSGSEKFSVQASKPPPSDFVFVVDSSGSMEPLIDSFITGFESIPASAYPPDTRMAVMNMIAHDLVDTSKPLGLDIMVAEYSTIAGYTERFRKLMNAEPGFLRFVSHASVQNYQRVSGENSFSSSTFNLFTKYPLCNDEWFAPDERNSTSITSKSKTCLGAAMQISGKNGIESGLTAVSQLLKKNSNMPLFRQGAGVHFVFISDTHDPGNGEFANFAEYVRQRPKFANIADAVKTNSKDVSVVKLHGVVPFSYCAKSEGFVTKDKNEIYEKSYLPEIEASGGIAVDMCKDDIDYKAVVNQILNEAKKLPAFKLSANDVKNVVVKVNGKDYKDFQVIGGNAVEVNGLMSNQDYTIEVSYTHESM